MHIKYLSTVLIFIFLLVVGSTETTNAQQQEFNGNDTTAAADTLNTEEKKGFFKRLFSFSGSGSRNAGSEFENIETTLREQKRKAEQLNNNFFEAAKQGNADMMVELLKQGADINTKNHHGRTALIEASRTGDHQIVKILIDMGASINVKDNYDATALAYANRNRDPGNPEIVLLLLKNNAVK